MLKLFLIAYSQRELKKQKYAISNTLSFSENLSKYCNVQLVNVDDEDFGLFEASSLLEKFLPDIIHCCDPKSFFTFRYFRKIFYRSERLYSSESAQTKEASKSSCRSEVSCSAIRYDEIMPLKYASLCAFNNKETLLKTLKTIKECAGILIDENQNARTFIKKHLFYYYQIILHSNAELFASYNFYSSINFLK